MHRQIFVISLALLCLILGCLAFYFANQAVKFKELSEHYREATEQAEKRFVQLNAEDSRVQQIAQMEANECERQIIELSKQLKACKGE